MIVNRKDIITRKIICRDKLIRISIDKNGKTTIDKEYNKGGRGLYILPSSIEKGLRKNIISNHIKRFGGDINQILDKLKEVENGKEKNK